MTPLNQDTRWCEWCGTEIRWATTWQDHRDAHASNTHRGDPDAHGRLPGEMFVCEKEG